MSGIVKKSILGSLVALSMIGFVGCGEASPKDTIHSLEEAMRSGNIEEINSLVTTPSEFTDEEKEEYKDYVDSYAKIFEDLNIDVTKEVIDGDKATVECKVTGPDLAEGLQKIMGEVFSAALEKASSGTEVTEKEMVDLMFEQLVDLPIEKRTGSLELTKVDGQWKIDTDEPGLFTNLLGGELPALE